MVRDILSGIMAMLRQELKDPLCLLTKMLVIKLFLLLIFVIYMAATAIKIDIDKQLEDGAAANEQVVYPPQYTNQRKGLTTIISVVSYHSIAKALSDRKNINAQTMRVHSGANYVPGPHPLTYTQHDTRTHRRFPGRTN